MFGCLRGKQCLWLPTVCPMLVSSCWVCPLIYHLSSGHLYQLIPKSLWVAFHSGPAGDSGPGIYFNHPTHPCDLSSRASVFPYQLLGIKETDLEMFSTQGPVKRDWYFGGQSVEEKVTGFHGPFHVTAIEQCLTCRDWVCVSRISK